MTTYADDGDVFYACTDASAGPVHAFRRQASNPVWIAHAAAIGSDLQFVSLAVLGMADLPPIGIEHDSANR